MSEARPCRNLFQPVLCLVLLGIACTPRPGPADPFSGGASSSRQGVRQYRVGLAVQCHGCDVTFFVGPNATSVEVDLNWSTTFAYTPLQATAIRVQATPSPGAGPVCAVQIRIDGDVEAEGGDGACRDGTTMRLADAPSTISVETVIPRR